MLDLKGLSKAQALAALYNASKPIGMGFLSYDPTPMTEEEAQKLLDDNPRPYFDYLHGRVMKLNFAGEEIEERLYDRDNGPGAAQRTIDSVVANKKEILDAMHKVGVRKSAEELRSKIDEPTIMAREGGVVITRMGLSDVKDVLLPAVDKATEK